MKIIGLEKMGVDELKFHELTKIVGGNGILYYLAYDAGFLFGTTAKVVEKITESLYYGTVTRIIK